MLHAHLRALGLANLGKHLGEGRRVDVVGLAALDARELDGAETVAIVLVMADDTADALEGALHGQVGAALDEALVRNVGGSGTGEVATLLDERLLGADHGGELLAEPGTRVDGVELHVAEGVADDLLALGFLLLDDFLDAGALGNEQVHAIALVHHLAETGGLGGDVDAHLGDVDRVHVEGLAGNAGGYGLCVAIEGEAYEGHTLTTKYGHCSQILVSAGQEVKAGDVIAKVGNTGNSTGPHLHLEVLVDGQYLNPLYFADTGDTSERHLPEVGSGGTGNYFDYDIPPEALADEQFAAMMAEAEKYLGYPYVWGGASPSTSFDCSGYVSWVINNCGVGWNFGRLTADGLLGVCTPVSSADAKPGDLIFFQGTYNTSGASHVGIYVGNGMMIHCGDPISYANINTSYWQQHFYTFGRLP